MIKVLAELVSPEAFLLGWQTATFSHGLSSVDASLVSLSLCAYNDTNHIELGPHP